MSVRKKLPVLLILLTVLTVFYNSYFPKFLVTGKYVANIEDEFATSGVQNGDKLTLSEDGTFQSDSWGNGTYILKGTEITFQYSESSFRTYFNRSLFYGQPRIIIFRDLKSEFVKE
jgi:hypothetical protein